MIYFTLCSLLISVAIVQAISSKQDAKRLVALGMAQLGTILLFAKIAQVRNLHGNPDPLPHAMMLTAIVVGFATLSIGAALILKGKA